jgi:hypothetical protein
MYAIGQEPCIRAPGPRLYTRPVPASDAYKMAVVTTGLRGWLRSAFLSRVTLLHRLAVIILIAFVIVN